MEFIAFDFDGVQFCIRDYQTLGVLSGVEFGSHCQAAASLGAGDQVDNDLMADDLMADQRTSTPVHGDE